jgi:hypothetical protein
MSKAEYQERLAAIAEHVEVGLITEEEAETQRNFLEMMNSQSTMATRSWVGRRKMNNRVITRERGVIPGCRAAGADSHMAVDGLGRPWLEVAKLPSTIDAWLAALREQTRQSRINRGADPETGEKIKVVPAHRSDLTPEQRAKAVQIGRIGFASAGARRKAA